MCLASAHFRALESRRAASFRALGREALADAARLAALAPDGCEIVTNRFWYFVHAIHDIKAA